MSTDPFGLRSVDPAALAGRPGVKWQLHPGRLAAWVADMDFPVAPTITDRLRSLIDRGALGYPNWGGKPSPAARAFVDRMATRFGWGIGIDRVHDLADVLQGVRLAVGMLTDPGDAIALHLPAYHPFLHTLRDMDRRLVPAPFDLDELAEVLRRERPRAMILCHPQNPTGHVFDRAELERLGALAIEHDLIIISDEIHSDLVYAPNTHIPFASISAEVEAAAFTMAIEGVDIFGGRRDARVLYAGVAPREPLKRLRDKIEAALQRAGLAAEERKFHPHVTLARLRGAPADRIGRFLEANGLLMSPPIPVGDFVLYDSVRGNHGAVYREIQRYGLHP